MSARVVVGSVIGLGVVVAGCAVPASSSSGPPVIAVDVCFAGASGFRDVFSRNCFLDVVGDTPQRMVIENVGDGDLELASLGFVEREGDFGFEDDGEFVVAPGDTHDVDVLFVGFADGEDTFRIESDADNDTVVDVTVKGHVD